MLFIIIINGLILRNINYRAKGFGSKIISSLKCCVIFIVKLTPLTYTPIAQKKKKKNY